VNVVGNCLATVVVARWEGELQPDAAAAHVAPISASASSVMSEERAI